jgi:DNA-binding SARP family transcriptional activator
LAEFRLLGPPEVTHEGRLLPLGGAKERGLLAFLLLNANRVVSRPALIDALWGEDPPPTADHALDVHVSRIRQALDPVDGRAHLRTRHGGYILHVDPEDIDLRQFERLFEEGRRELEAGDAAAAEEKLEAALRLCRGSPLAGLAEEPFAAPEMRRVEELEFAATEARIEALLALGRDAEVIPELEALVAQYPLRERLRAELMRALYQSGRQAEALQIYVEGREMLLRDLGLEPSRELQGLEREILRHDSTLNGFGVPSQRASAD